MSMHGLGTAFRGQGRFIEAEKLHLAALEIQKNVLPPEHPETLQGVSMLAMSISAQNRYAEAEKLHRAVLAVRQRVLPPDHAETLTFKALIGFGAAAGA
jgi:hypothetical protein